MSKPFKMKSSPAKLFGLGFHKRQTRKFNRETDAVGITNPKYDPQTGLATVGGSASVRSGRKRGSHKTGRYL